MCTRARTHARTHAQTHVNTRGFVRSVVAWAFVFQIIGCWLPGGDRYFKKQGFSKKLTLRKKLYDGWIKQYDGANLMECEINHDVDWTATAKMIRRQRDHLYDAVCTCASYGCWRVMARGSD